MRNRLTNGSMHVAFAACMFALGANFSACTDEFTLDEKKPVWLNSSIYETLESDGGYTNYLTLLADPDVNSGESEGSSLVEILSRTGSKTVFVANDKAWEKFFADNAKLSKSNPWHYAQSYDKLSASQKKLLLHTSMLNNAIVMENLASSTGNNPERGKYLRRYTDVEAVDTVTRIAVADLPWTYWSADRQAQENDKKFVEPDQWSRIRNGGILGYDSIYMVTDSSLSMMVHFTNEFMALNKITDTDFRVFMGRDRITSDVHIYDAHLDSADITCENGYVNMTEKPLAPLGNMAEVIRTNGRTNIFSHMLERFSVPFQNKTVGRLFARLYPEKFQDTDTLYTKRYYSDRSYGASGLTSDELGNPTPRAASLKFDPGWNGYYPPTCNTPQEDMGAMFVPNDDQLLYYFNEDAGRDLLDEYALNYLGRYDKGNLVALYQDIDQIPLDKVAAIINHCMQLSFVNSVPSKMSSLREEVTLERIFSDADEKLVSQGGNIDTVLMACNGAVYIMNNVLVPSDFNSVITPAFLHASNSIMRWAIYSDRYKNVSPEFRMGLNYFAYLKAMQSRFTFFMPSDEAMQYYYDPMSFTSKNKRLIRFFHNGKDEAPFPLDSYKGEKTVVRYNINEGTIGAAATGQKLDAQEIIYRLRQMLEHQTIVHQNGINAINTEEDEYYLSKNGMGIKVTRGLDSKGQKRVVYAQGGFQLENEREMLQPGEDPRTAGKERGVLCCEVEDAGEYKNGWTFTLNAPLIPAARSVFGVLANLERGNTGEDPSDYLLDEADISKNPYYRFFILCNDVNDEIIRKSGLVDESKPEYNTSTDTGRKNLEKAINKYRTFLDSDDQPAVDFNVQFFNNYRYTIFAPDNDAMNEAISNGLPTWDSIQEDFDNCDKDGEGNLTNTADSLRIQHKILYLTNFVRTHFADNSIFADKSTVSPTEMTTSSYQQPDKNDPTIGGIFIKVVAQRVKQGNETLLQVHDQYDTNKWRTASTDNQYKNIMTCDRVLKRKIKNELSLNGNNTVASSYAVVHLIDGVLNHEKLSADGKYPSFTDAKASRAYIKKFAIR